MYFCVKSEIFLTTKILKISLTKTLANFQRSIKSVQENSVPTVKYKRQTITLHRPTYPYTYILRSLPCAKRKICQWREEFPSLEVLMSAPKSVCLTPTKRNSLASISTNWLVVFICYLILLVWTSVRMSAYVFESHFPLQRQSSTKILLANLKFAVNFYFI